MRDVICAMRFSRLACVANVFSEGCAACGGSGACAAGPCVSSVCCGAQHQK